MSPTRLRPEQDLSAALALAACALGAKALRLDTPASGDRDFDLVFPDGHHEPFEITSNVDEAVRSVQRNMGAPGIEPGTSRV
jgi:hypothetical protein